MEKDAPTCPVCNIKKEPWSLTNWKCPKCGAIGGNTLDGLARRLEALEQTVAALTRRLGTGPHGQVA